MNINKDLKLAITRPTQAYLQKMSVYLRYRVAQHKNLINELLSQDKEQITQPSLYDFKQQSQVRKKIKLIFKITLFHEYR